MFNALYAINQSINHSALVAELLQR